MKPHNTPCMPVYKENIMKATSITIASDISFYNKGYRHSLNISNIHVVKKLNKSQSNLDSLVFR